MFSALALLTEDERNDSDLLGLGTPRWTAGSKTVELMCTNTGKQPVKPTWSRRYNPVIKVLSRLKENMEIYLAET